MAVQAISATGLKGFLQWLQQDQPAIYAATASKIAKAVPKGFSGFNGSAKTSHRLAIGRRSMQLRGYGGLGCCGIQSVGTCAATCGMSAVNICTSCAANGGSTCSSSLSTVASIVTSAASALLGCCNASSTYSGIVSSQLGRAGSGLSPLTISSAGAGVPVVAGTGLSGSTGTVLLIAGAGLLLWMLSSGGNRRTA
jgi:hypothetical protein